MVLAVYKVPKNLRYTKTHEWARITEEGYVLIGITDYAQKELLDVVHIEFTVEEGSEVVAGEPIADIDSMKTTDSIFSPISGVVKKLNRQLEEEPDLVNKDPYGKGWIALIKPVLLDEEWEKLLTPEEYEKLIKLKKR